MIQGIAVTLMVIHHLLGFPERISVQYYHVLDFSFFHFETMLGYFGRICIAIFAFNSGYGIMKKMNSFYSFAPVLVFSIGVFIKSRICFDWIKKILTVIGRYSTYIWLTHTFFAYYYWQKLLYSFRYSTLIVMICIVACIMVGFVFEYLKKGLGLKLIRRDS